MLTVSIHPMLLFITNNYIDPKAVLLSVNTSHVIVHLK